MYDVIVVGAGPAGLTASIYLRRNNKKVLVLEASSYGGQIINTLSIDNYPSQMGISGFDFAKKLYDESISLGSEIKFERVTAINNHDNYKEVVTNKDTYKATAIILAMGTKNKLLDLPNEKELVGKGISYCATCDGAFFKGKDVAVVGGGNTAFEDAIYLSNVANKVYLIHRRDEFRAEASLIEEAKNKSNIEFVVNSNISAINGKDSLESVIVKDNSGNEKELKISGLFVAIGSTPGNDIVKDLVKLDENGYIDAGEDCHTSVEGIFVSGDNRKKLLRQLVTATSDGAMAATEAIKYVNNK